MLKGTPNVLNLSDSGTQRTFAFRSFILEKISLCLLFPTKLSELSSVISSQKGKCEMLCSRPIEADLSLFDHE